MQSSVSAVGASKYNSWSSIILLTLVFWLSSCFVIDLVIMPSLYFSGMMASDGFVSAAYTIFWSFNRIELLCAGIILTGLFVLRTNYSTVKPISGHWIVLAGVLLTISLINTYVMTPEMSALGMNLNLFESCSQLSKVMLEMQWGYWILEVVKFVGGSVLLNGIFRYAIWEN